MAFSIDESLQAMPLILEELRELRGEVMQLRQRLSPEGNTLDLPVYDVAGLRALGYGRSQAYQILRSYGKRRSGRLRITRDKLLEYEQVVLN